MHKHIEHPNLIAAVSRLKPALTIGAQDWANLPMASWTEIFEEMEAAGDDSVDPKADGIGGTASESGAAGDTQVAGQEERWNALDNARFIPDL